MWKKIKYFLASAVIAVSLSYTATFGKDRLTDDEEEGESPTEEEIQVEGSDNTHRGSVDVVTDVSSSIVAINMEKEKVALEEEQAALHDKALSEALVRQQERKAAHLERERLRKLEVEKMAREAAKAKELASVSRDSDYVGQWQNFTATYYGMDCVGCSGITASGIDVRGTIYHNGMRVIAVDPRVIPLGSIVEIQSPHGTFKAIAADTGGAIKGSIVDILVGSEAESSKYGRHGIKLRMIKRGE